jgi:hypothetical protein
MEKDIKKKTKTKQKPMGRNSSEMMSGEKLMTGERK